MNTEFSLIKWQEKKAAELLRKPSFKNFFAGDPRANSGFSKQGRRRSHKAMTGELIDRGYAADQAKMIASDVVKYANLLYIEKQGE